MDAIVVVENVESVPRDGRRRAFPKDATKKSMEAAPPVPSSARESVLSGACLRARMAFLGARGRDSIDNSHRDRFLDGVFSVLVALILTPRSARTCEPVGRVTRRQKAAFRVGNRGSTAANGQYGSALTPDPGPAGRSIVAIWAIIAVRRVLFLRLRVDSCRTKRTEGFGAFRVQAPPRPRPARVPMAVPVRGPGTTSSREQAFHRGGHSRCERASALRARGQEWRSSIRQAQGLAAIGGHGRPERKGEKEISARAMARSPRNRTQWGSSVRARTAVSERAQKRRLRILLSSAGGPRRPGSLEWFGTTGLLLPARNQLSAWRADRRDRGAPNGLETPQ